MSGQWWDDPEVRRRVADEAGRVGRTQGAEVRRMIPARAGWTDDQIGELVLHGRPDELWPLVECLSPMVHRVIYRHEHDRPTARVDAYRALMEAALTVAVREAIAVVRAEATARAAMVPQRTRSLAEALRSSRRQTDGEGGTGDGAA